MKVVDLQPQLTAEKEYVNRGIAVRHYEGVLYHDEAYTKGDSSLGFTMIKVKAHRNKERYD